MGDNAGCIALSAATIGPWQQMFGAARDARHVGPTPMARSHDLELWRRTVRASVLMCDAANCGVRQC